MVEEEYDIPLLYVQAPSKTDVSPLPDGVEDAAGQEADQFLALLEKYDVATLDLRPVFHKAADSGDYVEDPLFFTTDHHWTPTGAFLGYQTLCERLAKDYRFKIDKKLTDPDSFHRYTFEDIFLGSQGRRVGSLYAGLDDLDLWSPTFPTDFTYTVPIVGIEREGPFIISLLFPERLALYHLLRGRLPSCPGRKPKQPPGQAYPHPAGLLRLCPDSLPLPHLLRVYGH